MAAALGGFGPVRQLVLQPTPFCNLDCRYCYLPNRSDPRTMSVETAIAAHRRVFESGLVDRELEVRWHAGEPLIVGREFYREVRRRQLDVVPAEVRVRNSLQTNGTLVDAAWCRFFRDEGFEVGVSIDGPADLHDRHRRSRNGRFTHAETIHAIELLHKHEMPFTIIAVLTIDSLDRADELYEYFAELRPAQVGFNIEEAEGMNEQSSLGVPGTTQRLQRFLERFWERARDGRVRCREFEETRHAIISSGGRLNNPMVAPGAIICVGWDGAVTGFSPELLGYNHPRYGTFTFGNVHQQSLREMFRSATFARMQNDIAIGVAACQSECPYFSLCGGGAPSNKLAENGRFESTATQYCTFRYQITAEIVLRGMEWELEERGRGAVRSEAAQ